MTTQLTSTLAHIYTRPPSLQTTPSWFMTLIAALPRSVSLFSSRAPFRSDAAPFYLSCSILLCAAPWCPLLLCAALSYSAPLCNTWYRSMPPELLCASPCWFFKISALCHSATPTYVPIILSKPWCWNHGWTHLRPGYITTHAYSHPSQPYHTPQLRHQKMELPHQYCLINNKHRQTHKFFFIKTPTHMARNSINAIHHSKLTNLLTIIHFHPKDEN